MTSWMPLQYGPMTNSPQYTPIFHQDYTTISEPPTNLTDTAASNLPERAYPLCRLCRGKKYGFTHYFHNTEIFPSPPHQLLTHIEQSYILLNRLQSLFTTYGRHLTQSQDEKDVKAWASDVEGLVNAVFESARSEGFELVKGKARMEEVLEWMRGVVEGLCGGVMGGVERMRSNVLLFEFRKLWERVWIGYLEDLKMVRMGTGLEDTNGGALTS
ncbi:hypothetical protein HYALB_00000787 [Hymenoscyphus albidus]|uniref:Uncharacterized protein n=1 Tax=Hymenoscyphus albidus TaxID=595503 RepID=A0A9N9LPI7_9HELO|nr:hypothetical protein HYALB_00000787 [Hymenoscyphus albidus]